MTNSNPETPPVVPPAPAFDSRRRLRELLSIPERDRTDEQWDEIIELEIQLAPGNRISAGEQAGGAAGQSHHGKGAGGGGNAGGNAQKKHRPRNNNHRRVRQNKPASGGGNPA